MEMCAIGGYDEVGKNMTAVKVNEHVFLFDCGFYLPGVIELQEEGEINYTKQGLRRVGAIPDDRILDDIGWRNKVRAIFISHAHLDHVAGLPFLADRYPNATIYATPFTMRVLESLIQDSNVMVTNKRKIVQSNSIHKIPGVPGNIKVEFIHTTHSTIDSTFVVLHTPEGGFFYALDYKFDNTPTFGKPPNYKRLKQLASENIKVAVIDTLYSYKETSNLSEKDADEMLRKAFQKSQTKNKALFVTTFSSHIERLNNIVKHASKTRREIVFLGRSLAKYIDCAIKVGKCPFQNKIKIIKYRRQVNSTLRKVEKNPGKYLVVCTGHQGEEGSILDRISKGLTDFRFHQGDHIIFSSSVIPTEVNIQARKILDERLEKMGVILQKNVHVHGHGSKEDKKKLIKMIKPKIIIPSHGNKTQEKDLICVAEEIGYRLGKTSYLISNGKHLKL
jgi:ribonuclease J